MQSIITLRTEVWPRLALGTLALLSLAGATGCSNIEPVAPQEAPITDPTKLYTKLTLNHPAINLSTTSPYNTVQLTATPRDAFGDPMPGLPAPTYVSEDTTKVRVTPEGMLTAVGLASSPGAQVTATLTVGGVTRADTAMVVVRNLASPPVLASLSIDPVPPDSGIWPVKGASSGTVDIILFFAGLYPGGFTLGADNRVLPRLVDTAGTSVSITPMVFEYQSLDPLVATIGRRSHGITTVLPGQVRIVAQTMAYGVAVADTATFTVTTPTTGLFTIAQSPTTGAPVFEVRAAGTVSNELKIRPYGIVGWYANPTADSVDVTFDDPTNVTAVPDAVCSIGELLVGVDICGAGSGNALVPPGAVTSLEIMRLRQFPLVGVYPFSTSTGATGRVIVTNEIEGL